jgi:alpha-tubulin suppressor-like RCC1 family protein
MKKLIRAGVMVFALSLSLLLFSCGEEGGGGAACTDADGDGYYLNCEPYDCNDSDDTVYPSAPELCDGLDNDCSGAPMDTEVDNDDDTYMVCEGDCDDSNDTVYPSAVELCDGLDNDCSGAPMDTEVDNDDDTYMVCEGDCDDSDPCNWLSCASCIDGDGDGHRGTGCDVSEDCDDSDDRVYPSAVEFCDGIDNQCPGDAGYGLLDERCPAVQVSVGLYHTCALLETGGVKCWGENSYGQLGDGTNNDSNFPVDVSGLTSGVSAIDAGGGHTCALLETGGMKCWGGNGSGQLGDGTNNDSNVPVSVSGLTSGVLDISAGGNHTCALLETGGVKCWGNNWYGQLGDGTNNDSNVPVSVSGLTSGVSSIDASEFYQLGSWPTEHTCAVLNTGGVKCWGENSYGQLGDGTYTTTNVPVDAFDVTDAVKVSVGLHHTCALLNTGEIKCWGDNGSGQLGDGTYTTTNVPVYVTGIFSFLDIAAGGYDTCALLPTGGMKCWGADFNANFPVDVSGLSSAQIIYISPGIQHICFILSTGGVKCWGYNLYGQLGDGTYNDSYDVPVDVFGLSPGVSNNISAGGYHTCAVLETGGIKCWGWNCNGQLGDGTSKSWSTFPVNVYELLSGALDISAGSKHTCALLNTGGVKCWGHNLYGQLGDGTRNDSNVPVDVSGLSSGVLDIAAGSEHTCALLSTGGIKCWGMNVLGQLGDGTNNDSNFPVDVSGLSSGVSDIAAGDYHTCALLSTGGMKCWGYNWYGQLGNGITGGFATVPNYVNGFFSGVLDISAGGEHTCALLDTGGMKCWGWNEFGQLGDGTNNDSNFPVDVSGVTSGVLDIAAGGEHTCALLDAGGMKCWGYNWYGQLGDGTNNESNVPVDVSGLTSGVSAIDAGFEHTCAFLFSGVMKCWGRNGFGQIGDGTNNDSNFPVDVFGYGF